MRETRLETARLQPHPAGDKPYLAFIDGLRTIAVVAVLFFHADRAAVSGGYVGVDIFFVISGFLITRICLSDGFSLSSFWYGRSRRILPAYFFVIFVTSLFAGAILLPNDAQKAARALLVSPLFIQNFVFWKQTNYFSPSLETNPFVHTWTLAVEWQFYVFMPLLVMAFRSRRRLLFAAFAAVMVLSFVASVWGAIYKPTPTFYLMPFRAWEFIIGSMLAMARFPKSGSRPLATALTAVGLAMLGLSIALFTQDTIFPGMSALLPCLGAGAVLAGGLLDPQNPLCEMLSLRPMRAVGQASYSIYLVHWPLIVFTRYTLIDHGSPLVTIAIIAASFALGFLSWRYIEQPFRQKDLKNASRRWAMSLSAMSVLAGMSLVVLVTDGLPQRFAKRVSQLEASERDQGEVRICLGYEAPATLAESRCRLSGDGSVRVVLWGDSTAAALAPGIAPEAIRRRIPAIFVGTDSCPPVAGMYGGFLEARPLCRRIQAQLPAVLRAAPVETLIVHAAWRGYLQRYRATFAADVARAFATYGEFAHHIVIVGPTPGARTSVPSAMARMAAFGSRVDLQPIPDDWRDVIEANRIVQDAAAKNGFAFVNLVDDLCRPDCALNLEGAPTYFDDLHITAQTARHLVEKHAASLFGD